MWKWRRKKRLNNQSGIGEKREAKGKKSKLPTHHSNLPSQANEGCLFHSLSTNDIIVYLIGGLSLKSFFISTTTTRALSVFQFLNGR